MLSSWLLQREKRGGGSLVAACSTHLHGGHGGAGRHKDQWEKASKPRPSMNHAFKQQIVSGTTQISGLLTEGVCISFHLCSLVFVKVDVDQISDPITEHLSMYHPKVILSLPNAWLRIFLSFSPSMEFSTAMCAHQDLHMLVMM